MSRRSIFNAPSSELEDQEEEEQEHQPSDFSVSDNGSESEPPAPSDNEAHFSADPEEDELPQRAPDPETEGETEGEADGPISGREDDNDSDDSEGEPYRWGGTIDSRRSVREFYAVVASLDRSHNASLANHLYSAHLIKKRSLAAPGSSSSSETDVNREHSPSRLADDVLLGRSKRFITNVWTAWPHPPEQVPREGEHRPNCLKSQPRNSHVDATTYDVQMKREGAAGFSGQSGMLEETLMAMFLRRGKEQLRERGEEAAELLPVLDEEVSSHLLRPVVRNVISRLDELLVGLYHERTYAKALIGGEEEKAAAVTAADRPKKRRKKAPSNPRKTKRAVTPMTETEAEQAAEDAEDEGGDGPEIPRPPRALRAVKSSSLRRRQRSDPEVAKTWAKKRRTRLRLRDWSNVLGVAALTGFDDEAVQRTTERCEAHFGETMSWRRLQRDDHLKDRRGGKEWTGVGPEGPEEKVKKAEARVYLGGILRDGFMAPVKLPVRGRDKRAWNQRKGLVDTGE